VDIRPGAKSDTAIANRLNMAAWNPHSIYRSPVVALGDTVFTLGQTLAASAVFCWR
jgi:hypothetical protein